MARTAAQAALAMGPSRLGAQVATLATEASVGLGAPDGKAALAVLPGIARIVALPVDFYSLLMWGADF